MKKILILSLFSLSFVLRAQGNVGINTSTPDPSALLEVVSPPSATNVYKGMTLPKVQLIDFENTSMINVGATGRPAHGLLVYNTNKTIPSGKGIYWWNDRKRTWEFIINQDNVDLFKNLVRIYSPTTIDSYTINTISGEQQYSIGDSTTGWTMISNLDTSITVDKKTNSVFMKFSGMVNITRPSSTNYNQTIDFAYAFFIDDKLVYATAEDKLFSTSNCGISPFYTAAQIENLLPGTHTVKFGVKVRRKSTPETNTIKIGGTSDCQNLNAFEATTNAGIQITQDVKSLN